jgi:Ice-binding-like/Putative Ig domain/IPTL-CTERM motif
MFHVKNILNRMMSVSLVAGMGFAAFLLVSAPALAVVAVAPPLGVAQQFGALGHSGVTGATGTGVLVSGDVGSSPTPTIINFPPSSTVPPFIVHYANDGVVAQAHQDAITAYNALALQGSGTVLADNLATVGALTPGVYSFTSGAPDLPATATLTLNDPSGNGIFVFNVASTLTANVNSHVVGTANPCNIYWRVGTSATLNGVNFKGIVIADASITLGSSANLAGQALAGTGATGAVTMAGSGGNTISGCSVLLGPPCPTITLAPPTLPVGRVGVAYSQQITATGGTGSYTFSVASGTLPAGLTLSSGGLLSGTPTTAGSSPVTIAATDGNGCPGVIPFVIVGGAFTDIPTLSGWGLMTLMVLIGVASIYRLRRI